MGLRQKKDNLRVGLINEGDREAPKCNKAVPIHMAPMDVPKGNLDMTVIEKKAKEEFNNKSNKMKIILLQHV